MTRSSGAASLVAAVVLGLELVALYLYPMASVGIHGVDSDVVFPLVGMVLWTVCWWPVVTGFFALRSCGFSVALGALVMVGALAGIPMYLYLADVAGHPGRSFSFEFLGLGGILLATGLLSATARAMWRHRGHRGVTPPSR